MNVLVLTGAGISAESGVPTFRDNGGLWEGHRPEEVATPEAFARAPELVHRFYNQRRHQLLIAGIAPNAAHLALAEFERRHQGAFLLVTQNVDDLHARAGSQKLLAMHGELRKARCLETGKLYNWERDLHTTTPHPEIPHAHGRLRPHIVWFGELPLGLDRIEDFAKQADLFLAIGTSAVVYPAAGIVHWTPTACQKIEINLENTPQSPHFDQTIRGSASVEVPRFLNTIL